MTALDIGLICALACFAWWASTGFILLLVGAPERTYRWSMLGGSVAAMAAFYVVAASGSDSSRQGVVIGFLAALTLWGVVEMAFLMGYVVGPRRAPLQPRVPHGERFRQSAAALAYHELALVCVLILLGWMARGVSNPTAFHVFALLWIMRLSTKLNIFLGVSNANESFLPARISYLASYFRAAPMNPLFPISVTAGTIATALLFHTALRADASLANATAAALLATFAALAVLEHWLLVLPLPSMALWPWAHPTGPQATAAPVRADVKPHSGERAAQPMIVPAVAGKT